MPFFMLLRRRSRQRERLNASMLSIGSFVRSSVRLSVAKMRTKTLFSQFRAVISIDDLQEVLHGLFKDCTIGPLKFKMADCRHFKNRFLAIRLSDFSESPISVKFCTAKQNSIAISYRAHVTETLNFENSKWRTAAILQVLKSPYILMQNIPIW